MTFSPEINPERRLVILEFHSVKSICLKDFGHKWKYYNKTQGIRFMV